MTTRRDCVRGVREREMAQARRGKTKRKKKHEKYKNKIVITGWMGKLFSRLIETNNIQFTHSTRSGWAVEDSNRRFKSGNFRKMWFKVMLRKKKIEGF
jgi:hypothetical protein